MQMLFMKNATGTREQETARQDPEVLFPAQEHTGISWLFEAGNTLEWCNRG